MYIIIKYCEKLINVLLLFLCFVRISIDNDTFKLLTDIILFFELQWCLQNVKI